jgi:starch-binding outer membrane protein, SusD/RagB family
MKELMKKRIKGGAILATIALMTLLYSCKDSFLQTPITGQLNASILSNKAGLETAIIAAYSQVNGRGGRMASPSNWVWGSIRGGDANKGTDPGDFSDINPIQRFEALASQGVILEKWNGNYEGVARCNSVLRLLAVSGADVTDADKLSYTAQARFLRGHFYFELKRGFGNTPYVDESIDVGGGIEKVKNDVDLWPKIEDDMNFAYTNLAATQGAVGKVNKGAAGAYLAKIYMYENKFTEAKAIYDAILNTDGTGKMPTGQTSNGKQWTLLAKFADVFKASNDNHSESIWAYQAAANTGSVNNANPEFDLNWPYNTGADGPGNCCSFFQPSFAMGNSFRVTAGGQPLLDESYNSAANEVKTDMGLETADPFTPDAGPLDPRIDHSIGRRGIPYLDWADPAKYTSFPGKAWIRNQPNAGPYSTKKFVYYKSDKGSLQDNTSWTPGYTAINFPIVRLGDVLLMAAEAEVEVGSLAQALVYTNAVRNRAANAAGWVKKADGVTNAANYVITPYAAFASKAEGRTAIRFERKLELSGEGHRFFDLVRWGTANTEVTAYLNYERNKTQLGALKSPDAVYHVNKDELLPIPQPQIDIVGSDVLKQNPGY